MKRSAPTKSNMPQLNVVKDEEMRGNRVLIPQAKRREITPATPTQQKQYPYPNKPPSYNNNTPNTASTNNSKTKQQNNSSSDFFTPQKEVEHASRENLNPRQSHTNVTTCTISIDMILNKVVECAKNRGFMFKDSKFELFYVELYATVVKVITQPTDTDSRWLIQVRDDSSSELLFVELGVPDVTINVKQTYQWIGHIGVSHTDQSTKLLRCIWVRDVSHAEFKVGREELRHTLTNIARCIEP